MPPLALDVAAALRCQTPPLVTQRPALCSWRQSQGLIHTVLPSASHALLPCLPLLAVAPIHGCDCPPHPALLQRNDWPETDAGVQTAFAFAMWEGADELLSAQVGEGRSWAPGRRAGGLA